MSNVKTTVKISENDLINLIETIVTEAVEIKKKEWITEQADSGNKTPLLESKLAQLEAKLNKLTEGK